ncbi:chlorophyll synthase ChlG [Rubritepida flocculans]|jgi:chlorophyll synthase|uniref:chlorophyll synthase ChlG n=1 Tax=Rubritepida flocculans TaxID=182403 RepID=UPI000404FF32|nr:chlorophyll synthase ChlG [Rubritepida flocculans]
MSGRVMPNPAGRLDPAAVLELFKPVTWFPPVWAFLCGAVSAGAPFDGKWGFLALGLLLAGPMVCATSQAVNDWFDRHVDAINEPGRPIPSGRIPGRWGLWIALFWSGLSLLIGAALGPWGFGATVLALILAWLYSAPPLRLKRNGWLGCAATGLSYETLPWITAAAIMAGGAPRPEILLVALLYGIGAHGIMTLNDFKAIEGDRRTGIASLPVLLGPERAARVACWMMAVPQLGVVALLLAWGAMLSPIIILGLLGVQAWAMRRMMTDPRRLAPWYNATGVGPYVLGMLAAAFALRGMA